MTETLHFDPGAYFRRMLPWLAAAFLASFAVETMFLWELCTWYLPGEAQGGQSHRLWLVGWVFLLLGSEAIFKGVSLYWYQSAKKRWGRCYVSITSGMVTYHKVHTAMSREQLLLAMEGSGLPLDGKKEYLHYMQYRIGPVDSVTVGPGGRLVVTGSVSVVTVNEMAIAEQNRAEAGTSETECSRIDIPAYFAGMGRIRDSLANRIGTV